MIKEHKYDTRATVVVRDILAHNRGVEDEIREKLTNEDIMALTEGRTIEMTIYDNTFYLSRFGQSEFVEDLNLYIELDISVDVEGCDE